VNGSHVVTVSQVRCEAEGTVSLRLRGHAGSPLPAWTPGAHIDVVLPSGLVRQYSLCGEPDDPEYMIAVLREPDGRGGSAEIHDTALVGRQVRIHGPTTASNSNRRPPTSSSPAASESPRCSQ
jgi:ferredoxin-NADP reductase